MTLTGAGRGSSSLASQLLAAWADACTVPPDSARRALYLSLIQSLLDAGVWTKLDALYVFASHDSQAGLLNVKAPGTFNATLTNAPTFTTDRGFAGNGTNSFIDSNFNPATAGGNFAQNSACFGFWSRSSGQLSSSSAGWFDGTDGTTILPRTTGDIFSFRINQVAASATGGLAVTNGVGLMIVNRSETSATQAYRNAVALSVTTAPNQTSTALNSASLRFGSITAATFSTLEFAAGVIGGSLNADEQSALYSTLNTYMAAVGAA